MTAQEIKALPRTEDGLFDLSAVQKSIGAENKYQAAEAIYPVYAAFETSENKKEGYPDIMKQMRVLATQVKDEFTLENAAYYLTMLLHTVQGISPEIYENYRELLDQFRAAVKRVLQEYYTEEQGFAGEQAAAERFCETVREACAEDLLLTEKYQMCF